jgi:saccharopine dehydrogenase-like NADP-dependent oxidoreductase
LGGAQTWAETPEKAISHRKQILILGAWKSAPYLIRYLLDLAEENDWFVTVGDLDVSLARERVAGHSRGEAIRFDVNDTELRQTQIEKTDIVVSMLAPAFHHMVAIDCVHYGVHLVTVSYRDAPIRALERDALRKNILILSEMGMDPGIDHMSAMALIRRIQESGGVITSFCSYGSGLPAPDTPANPLRYVITWNPRNIVVAAQYGAQYLEKGKIKVIPYHEVFHHTWVVDVDGIGEFEAYPNRDSLSYQQMFGLPETTTMIRGTLRYPGWSETWCEVVRLGLSNDTLRVPDLKKRTYEEVVEMFLPLSVDGAAVDKRVARWLQISPTGKIMENLRWLGVFSQEKVRATGDTAADMMTDLISRKLALPPDGRDMVILQHELEVSYPRENDRREKVISTLVHYGEPGGFTAMAKTVGLPAAIGVKLILKGELSLAGCLIPTHPSIYQPVLRELEANGVRFTERTVPRE